MSSAGSVSEGFRLSPQQRRLWQVRLHAGVGCALVEARLGSGVEAARLRRALGVLAERHEILRTTFLLTPGRALPVQQIHDAMAPELRESDLSDLDPAAQAARLAADFTTALAAPIDPTRGPVLVAELIRLGPERHALRLRMPALCADAAALCLLLRELATELGGGADEEEVPQYVDLAEWQNELLESEDTVAGREYWQRREPAPGLRLAIAEEGPAVWEPADFETLGQAQLLTAWAGLLARLGEQPGVPEIAVAFDGRRHAMLAAAPGLLTRDLPLRLALDERMPFAAAVEATAAALEEAAKRQEFYDPPAGAAALFAFEFLDARSAGLDVRRCQARREPAEVKLSALRRRDGWSFEVTAGGLLERLEVLLAAALENPATPLEALPILTVAERRTLLEELTATALEVAPALAHERLAAQAEIVPERVALVFEDAAWSFGVLQLDVERVASALHAAGAVPETRVGLLLERSPELVVAVFGTLRAGAAFVPLDPTLPARRLDELIADAGVSLLLSRPAHVARLAAPPRALDVAAALRHEPSSVPPPVLDAESLAYAIYTSGSTGKPKGVMIRHGGLANHLTWVQETYRLGVGDRTLLKTPIGFDVSVRELFWPLTCGVPLVVARPDGHQDASYLAELAVRERLTVLNFVPALLRAVLAEPAFESCRGLRLVLSGGEALAGALRERFEERSEARLANQYGPTETTVTATFHVLDRGASGVPIGRPVANARAWVVDTGLRLVPFGVPGELVIAGAGLARGYLGRAAATAAVFVPDPFAAEPGGRLYRTGDRVAWGRDGAGRPALGFIGRRDHQVKIRGVRIELGEVEAALAELPGVAAAAAVLHPDPNGGEQLVGFVVAAAAATLHLDTLRAQLHERLPAAMVPAQLAVLPALPTTTAGKLDRQALAKLEIAAEEEHFEPPRGMVEEVLAGIWGELLRLGTIGRDTDFFAHGGHSLLATQLIARVREALRIELPLASVFEAPTVAALAALVAARSGGAAALTRIEPAPRDQDLPLSFAQLRLWFIEQLEPGRATYNIPAAIWLDGALDPAALETAFSAVVNRHETLRTTFPARRGTPRQQIDPPGRRSLPQVDLEALEPARRERAARRLASAEARRPFDLERGPLARPLLVRLGPVRHLVVLTLHHAISDGWSRDLLLGEIVASYSAALQNRPAVLPALPVQYADYAVWQQRHLGEEALRRDLDYWRAQLAGGPEVLALPSDRPRPAVQRFLGASRPLVLPAPLAERLSALARSQGVTLFMVLLGGYQTLLARLSGEHRVRVGTPLAGRERVEIEPLIGYFVNTLVLACDLGGRPSFSALLEQVRRVALAAHEHQHLPFERLVEELAPERDLSHTPIFQAVLALQNVRRQSFELPGLSLRALDLETGTAKFDLTFTLEEGPAGLAGVIDYNVDLFDPTTLERWRDAFVRLLAAAVSSPASSIDDLPLLAPAARHQLAVEWAVSEPAPPATGLLLHEALARQAKLRPDAIAVSLGEQKLSYRALARRARWLAGRLRKLGVGPERIVGLCVGPSLELVIGIAGILEAGGCYVPLDPALPAERLGFLLADAEVDAVVTLEALQAALGGFERPLVYLDTAVEATRGAGVEVSPEHPAYVIYTSGSTGKPKGVVVTHRNAARLFSATRHWLALGLDEVWSLFHSSSFDFSVWELWGALAHGGRLAVVPHAVRRSPEDFHRLLAEERVTSLSQTPSAFRQLQRVATASSENLALEQVVFGGEALELRSLAPWFERFGDARPRLINMYGITETTVHVTYRPLARADLTAPGSLIGRPIPDLELLVLDPRGRPAPHGVVGELHVGGAGLARGYLGRPGLTAGRFVPQPGGARLYRTGDLARYLASGELEYLGRLDHQVKVRGFRIELGEIEVALAAHVAVAEAVVRVRGDRLVAWVVPAAPPLVSTAALREHLAARLPEHMVPAVFVEIAALPLTPNGKLDLKALPEPGAERPRLEHDYVPPRTATEEILAAIWAEVLGLERVGVHDNFFALGGDSIRSVRALALARERGLDFSLQQLFAHQTLAELAPRIESGSSIGAATSAPFSLVSEDDRRRLPAGLEDAYPLSSLQAGMFFHMGLAPESPPYHNVDSWYLRGGFDPDLFRRAVETVVARHATLRTSFELEGGDDGHGHGYDEALQLVHTWAEPEIGFGDLRGLDPERQVAEIKDFIQGERRRFFDLRRPPLLRFHLHRRSEETFQFTITELHPILDGWSLQSTLAEIFVHYAALLAGATPPPADPPPVSYRDFVAAERAALASAETRRFWAEVVADAEPYRLPRWQERPSSERRTARSVLPIEPELQEKLTRLARETSVPFKSVCLAAHLAALGLLSDRDDVITGYVSQGRPEQRGGEDVRGLFLNTLPCRLRLAGLSWRELVAKVFDWEWQSLPHRRFPLSAIQQGFHGGRLSDVLFNYLHFHVLSDTRLAGFEVLDAGLQVEPTDFTLVVTFHLSPATSELEVFFGCDLDALAPRQIANLLNCYRAVLVAMAENPAERWERLLTKGELLSPAERHQLLYVCNDTPAVAPPRGCLHERFEHHAERAPDAVAVTLEGAVLSYGELERRANRLANHLRRAGVGPESRVAVCLERSLEMIVALLGILKTGGAYVPLDPAHPEERRQLILDDALGGQASPLLSQADVGEGAAFLRESAARPDPRASAASLAYVIYTSGSTGTPKGVEIAHANVLALLDSTLPAYRFDAADVWTLFHSYAFDFSVWELWGALALGGRLVVVPYWESRSPQAFARILERERVTVLNQTPSAFQQLVEVDVRERPALPALRTVIFGGEALALATLEPWFARHGDRRPRLVNMYGITETTVHVSFRPLAQDDLENAQRSPIGSAIPGWQLYGLDRVLQPAPLGVPGELCVGGMGLARGYLGRARLTAERFVPDPFGGAPGARLYRSGDLGLRLASGDLAYQGRIDTQVKIRGFRIELGEIESALLAQPEIDAAVVLVHADQRLVAYLAGGWTPDGDSAARLREALEKRLPAYMVPAIFLPLASLPLNANGKVDRAALRALALPEPAAAEAGYVAPRGWTEELLAEIFAQVLRRERVGVKDDFFALGGHSLLATQVIARVRRSFRVDLPLRELFEAPTVAALAPRVERATLSSELPPLVPRVEPGPAELSFAQQRMWFLDQLQPGNPVYDVPMAARFDGRLDLDALERALGAIVRRHDILRTIFVKREGRPVQLVLPPAPWPLALVDLGRLETAAQEVQAHRLARAEAERAFDLERGPLLHALVVRLATDAHLLLACQHHVTSDGWSIGLLARELQANYRAFAAGAPSPLAPLPVQYADYAAWQRGWLQGEALEREIAHWRERLAGAPAVLELPTDRPRSAFTSRRGSLCRVRVPAAVASGLRAAARRAGATPFMVLLAAFDVLLARLSGQRDLSVGTPVAGRTHVELEELIGLFINTLVLRADLGGNPAFDTLVGRVRETTLAAFAHQALPFEKLVEELEPERSLAHSPLFQVMFVMQNMPLPTLELPELEIRTLTVDAGSEKFDLTLTLAEEGDGYRAALSYCTALFDATTIERMLGHYVELLAAVAMDGDRKLEQIDLLSAAQRHQLTSGWNDTAAADPGEGSLIARIERRVETSADAIALVIPELGAFSYRALDALAGQLAADLRAEGVGPESVVAICAERSAELVIGLLGTLKAGGAYLPLDPDYPRERLAHMIGSSGARWLLVQEGLGHLLPDIEGVRSLALSPAAQISTPAVSSPELDGENLAYVIYTSGSTGLPKGAMNTHRAICNRLEWMQSAYRLDDGDRVLQKTPHGFDVSVWEFFWPLLTGSCLVVARPGGHRDPGYLAGVIRRERITTLHFVPSMLRAFLADPAAAGCRGIRRVIASGEALPADLVQRFFQTLPAELHNLYGPTEAAVDVTAHACTAADGARSNVTIGRPISNVEIHLVDNALRLSAPGAAGELMIGGIGLARGYLARPSLTAQRFIPDPISEIPGRRLYRTGDLVRRRGDGALEFLGRIDHQVKIRGYRIELGEIEAVLTQRPEISDAVVIARPFGSAGDLRLVAYVVAPPELEHQLDGLRRELGAVLPEPMIPSFWVRLDEMPLSPNGKVDRKRLPAVEHADRLQAGSYEAPQGELEQTVAAVWQEVLELERVGRDHQFFDLGGHSLLLIQVQHRLGERLGREIAVLDLFRYPTVRSLAAFLERDGAGIETRADAWAVPAASEERAASDDKIAVIGLAGRFPGADDVETFWRNLREGVEGISFFSDDELRAAGVSDELLAHPDYVKAKGVITGAEAFDAGFFGMSPREAELTDPQHRLLVEHAFSALENAGYAPERTPGRISFFAGASTSFYWQRIEASPAHRDTDGFQGMLANDRDFLATRVSYRLNLTGPSLTLQTACSTSLVAVHMACQSLLRGESEMALAGGVGVRSTTLGGYLWQEGGILSRDGHCRAFDADAAGTLPGQGVGVVVLKRLRDALADGDTIHAVILGSAINNDGAHKIGFTAPSIDGQAAVIRAAQREAGVAPATIGYVEAHGTGTALGDPIEVAALAAAFGDPAVRAEPCALGSVKASIGHLDAAAGVAGLIKAVLALRHGELPPHLHFRAPHPQIDFVASGFKVQTELAPWPAGPTPRRAGVSSFGMGGTNVHVVLEEAPPAVEAPAPARPWQLLLVSARTPAALAAQERQLAAALAGADTRQLADAAHTLRAGRRRFEHRRFVVARDGAEAAALLGAADLAGTARAAGQNPPVAFLFPGQGSQHLGMGRGLYAAEPRFRATVDRCAELLAPGLGLDLRRLFEGEEFDVEATWLAQPALFVVEYALAELWRSWGVEPKVLAGHSVGEYVAACLAGVFELPDALALIAERGRLMQAMAPGGMWSVALEPAALLPRLGAELSLAAINAPQLCVVSGPVAAGEALAAALEREGVSCRRLHTSHAFHSAMVEPALAEFEARVRQVALSAPRLPLLSNVSGTWIRAEEATDPAYWVRHLRGTVRFESNLRELLKRGGVLLEVGPGQSLAALARRHPERDPGQAVVASLPGAGSGEPELPALLGAAGRLWLAGVELDGTGFVEGEGRRRVPLPGYPFERKIFALPPVVAGAAPVAAAVAETAGPQPFADWLYLPSWRQTAPLRPAAASGERWLVFADGCGVADELVAVLEAEGHGVVRVEVGVGPLLAVGEGRWALEPGRGDDYRRLLGEVAAGGGSPGVVAHLWSLTGTGGSFEESQRLGFDSLFFLAQSLGEQAGWQPVRLGIVADGMLPVSGEERLVPGKATLAGAGRILGVESPDLEVVTVDVALSSGARERLARRLAAELRSAPPSSMVAWRGPHRWVEDWRPLPPAETTGTPPWREGGVYLITGGLGGLGLEIAEYLARGWRARLVLVGRTAPAARVARVQALEQEGAVVVVETADVADRARMAEVFASARARFGAVHGVIHAAGLPPGGMMQLKDHATVRAGLRAKTEGALLLAELGGEELELLVLCSSLSALLNQPGRFEYAAANTFLDVFAHHLAAETGTRVVSINWDTWREAGMAHDEILRLGQDPAAMPVAMSTAEGLEVLERALAAGVPQVVVSIEPLPAVVARNRARRMSAAVVVDERAGRHPRPPLATPFVAPRNPTEAAIARIWSDLLGLREVGIHDNFFELGGDSVVTIQSLARLRKQGLELSPKQVFDLQTVAELAQVVGTGTQILAEQGLIEGELALTPIQRWFFEQNPLDPHHFNQSLMLEARRQLDPVLLGAALAHLERHHDALRLRFALDPAAPGGWKAWHSEPAPAAPSLRVDLSALPAERRRAALERAAGALQASLDLERGPLTRLAVFSFGAGEPARLLWIIHHLVVDAIVWRFLIEDLTTVYEQLRGGAAVALPAKTTALAHWSERLAAHAAAGGFDPEIGLWSAARQGAPALPLDLPADPRRDNVVARRDAVHRTLGAEPTRLLLQEIPQTRKLQIQDVLLAALAHTLVRGLLAPGETPAVLVDLEGHGREPIFDDVDLSRTAGWMTTLYPARLSLAGVGEDRVDDPGAVLRAVKEQLERVPAGLSFGALRYLAPERAAELAELPAAEISFLYLGQIDAGMERPAAEQARAFVPALEASGAERSPRALRPYVFELTAAVAGGELRLTWIYGTALHHRATIESLLERWITTLESFIDHCEKTEEPAHAPASFPSAQLSREELEDVLAELGEFDDE